MRAAAGHTVPGGAPAERPGQGQKVLLWLAVAGAAAGVAGAGAVGASRMYHRQGGPLCYSEGRSVGVGELTAAVSG